MKTRKPWREKLNHPGLPRVVEPKSGSGTLLLPDAHDIEALVRSVPEGELITVSQIRRTLAQRFAADTTCPLLTGIFVRIIAEASEEEFAAGKARVTPYWRVVKDDGSLNPKFPGGVERQAERLREEGHRVVAASGRKPPRCLMPASEIPTSAPRRRPPARGAARS